MQGSNPKDPKEAEGEVWVDDSAPKTDAAAAAPKDTTQVKK